ncbi:lipopolysaccharide transport periplasmic protein LptA [Campylobacter sp. faydin G-24]|uniref:Lipopolysaccharide transport periplasmic protein LptA n=1 Tax=Campylobacter anatolicus TaxID=2829105 RepID=A0ABS5HFH3_9BACT|nr:lipopolysaccharide transport periplasmic protein LptA [Campylobacter anatolicus]MBR8462553.1 lipopolysaccharide transport periplasmic protein LptA [Campylobacter anatolicus]MBR8463014.1 lipopolysaccharide transport periplasmic protein LptA [Campylobacter anatolicus]MBR8465664.1 lipopolysaccharide transport periplasmic protein LptA [Campylobacter anatolicus]
MDRARKALAVFFISTFVAFAEQVEITSDSFFADEGKQIGEFNGNVYIKKGNYDELKANKVIVHFDKNRQPVKYIATGNAKLKLVIKDKHYDGKGDTLTYEPTTQIYTVIGNGYIHEVETDKNIYGEKIVVNQLNGTYNVNSGDKKPVKFIFQVEDKAK